MAPGTLRIISPPATHRIPFAPAATSRIAVSYRVASGAVSYRVAFYQVATMQSYPSTKGISSQSTYFNRGISIKKVVTKLIHHRSIARPRPRPSALTASSSSSSGLDGPPTSGRRTTPCRAPRSLVLNPPVPPVHGERGSRHAPVPPEKAVTACARCISSRGPTPARP